MMIEKHSSTKQPFMHKFYYITPVDVKEASYLKKTKYTQLPELC